MDTGFGNLFIKSVSMTIGRNDAGVYSCTANNSVGIHTINISVNCKELMSDCLYFNQWDVFAYSNS